MLLLFFFFSDCELTYSSDYVTILFFCSLFQLL